MKVFMILGKVIEVIVTEMADDNRVIVSEYKNGYEFINTIGCRSLLLLKVAKYLQGYKPWGMNSNVNFEWFDSTKDQVTHYSPWYDL